MVLDLVFLVDTSSSIGAENFRMVRKFIVDIVDHYKVGSDTVQVAMVRYSRKPEILWGFEKHGDKTDLLYAIEAIPYPGGGTNTGLALETVTRELLGQSPFTGRRIGVPAAVVAITDGPSIDNVTKSAAILREYATIMVVGVSELVQKKELETMASDPVNKYVLQVNMFEDLTKFSRKVAATLCDAKGGL